jgi:SAM-dependent methyltransferase
MKVFVSSTYEDLRLHRELVQSVIRDYELTFLGMESFGSAPYPPLQNCLDEVERSDVVICMLGARYGDKPNGNSLSYTHHELNRAKALGRPVLAYLLSPEVPVLPKHVDVDQRDRLALEQLKTLVLQEYQCSYFTTPESIARRVSIDISKNFLIQTEKGRLLAEAARKFRETAYDAEAKWYDCWYNGHWQSDQPFKTIIKIIEKYRSSFSAPPSQVRILDCACGTGNSFVAFTKAGYDTFGTDGSREMLSYAKENSRSAGISTTKLISDPLNWIALSLDQGQFQNQPFDIIVNTSNSFCHIPSTPEYMHQALSNFYRMLKPGGLLIIDTKKYVREDLIGGVPIYKELQYFENENAWHIRTDRNDPRQHAKYGDIHFHTWIHHDVDYSFTQPVNRALIVLTVYGPKVTPETLVVPYYPLPAALLQEQMAYAGFSTKLFPAKDGLAKDWKYDIVVGEKKIM